MARLIEVELHVSDVERSRRFYQALGVDVGEPEVHEGEGIRHAHAVWGKWDAEGAFLMLNLYPATSATSRVSIGFVAEDLDGLHRRLTRDGVEVVTPPGAQPWGRVATYRDPDGNTVSVTERPR